MGFGIWNRTWRQIVPSIILVGVSLLPCAAISQLLPLRVDGKVFAIETQGLSAVEPLNHMHGFDLRVARRDGSPQADLTVTLQGARKFAPNELPTSPKIEAKGRGHFRVEGLRFHMAGEWTLVFNVGETGATEPLSIDIVVK